jgi:hypothetical protein
MTVTIPARLEKVARVAVEYGETLCAVYAATSGE